MGVFSKIVKDLELEDTVNSYKDEFKKVVSQELNAALEADRQIIHDAEKQKSCRYIAVSLYRGNPRDNEWNVYDANEELCFSVSRSRYTEVSSAYVSVCDARKKFLAEITSGFLFTLNVSSKKYGEVVLKKKGTQFVANDGSWVLSSSKVEHEGKLVGTLKDLRSMNYKTRIAFWCESEEDPATIIAMLLMCNMR